MPMNWGNAIGAGILGAVFMTAILLVLRALGVTPMNLEMMLGTLFTESPGLGSWFLGLAIHLAAGALFGVVYGAIMEAARRRGPGVGVAIAVPHAILSGILLPVVGAMHPLVQAGRMVNPGAFAAAAGPLAFVLFVGLHLVFGSVVGGAYELRRFPAGTGPSEIPRRPPTAVYRG
jgi:hypothetical protein